MTLPQLHKLPGFAPLRGWLLATVALLLPVSMTLSTWAILLLAAHWLLEGDWRARGGRLRRRPLVAIYLGFYLLYVVGMLYTQQRATGWGVLERKAALLAFPLLLGTVVVTPAQVRRALWGLVAGCTLASVALLARGLERYLDTGTLAFFHRDSDFVEAASGIHRVYLGCYLLVALTALGHWWVRGTVHGAARPAPGRWRAAVGALGATFVLVMVLTLPLTALLAGTLVAVGLTVRYVWRRHGRRRALLGLLLAVVTLATAVATVPPVRGRVARAVYSLDEGNGPATQNSANLRVLIWRAAWAAVARHPWLGAGTGDDNAALYAQYEAQKFEWGVAYGFNAHNQYLQTTLALGVVGLAAWLLHLAAGGWCAWRRRDPVFLIFLFIFAFCCLSESLLERQKGVVLYALFSSLFSFVGPAPTSPPAVGASNRYPSA